MKQLRALAWKEWRESRAYLFIGLGVFLGLPLIGGLEAVFRTTHRFEIEASIWVMTFGGVLAVIVAVAGTCRDMSSRLEDFWRSRPVTTVSWFLVKYLVGLAVVLASCMVPIAVELFLNRDKQPLPALVWFPFLWAAIYSIGFLAGCIVRKTAQAATLALAGLLLVYLMPVILPPLEWLNTSRVTERGWPYSNEIQLFDRNEILFALGMGGLAIVGLLLSLLVIRRNWHVVSGQKTMYGLVATAFLLLFTSAAFQLGTNLPVLQQIQLPESETIEKFRYDGRSGYVLTFEDYWNGRYASLRFYNLRTIESDGNRIKLGKPFDIDQSQHDNLVNSFSRSLSPEVGGTIEWIYPAEVKSVDDETPRSIHLNLLDSMNGAFIRSIHLWDAKNGLYGNIDLHVWNDRLFVIGKELMVFDINDPKKPRPLPGPTAKDFYGPNPYRTPIEGPLVQHLVFGLPEVPGLPPEERLKIVFEHFRLEGSYERDTLCVWMTRQNLPVLVAYHLTNLTDTTATFDEIGEFNPSFLERGFGMYGGWQPDRLQNGLLYHSDGGRSDVFNSAISVFDTRGSHPMRRIGHFAAPQAYMVQPLPNGQAIAGGGNKLYLVGPPPQH